MFETTRIPYAAREGQQLWPDGARMAVLVYTAAEQWQWYENETIKAIGTFTGGRGSAPSASTRSAVAYGFEVGLPRIAEIFREFGMSTTLWASGVAVEQYPDAVAALAADGHELGCHGYSQGAVMAQLSRGEQQEAIGRSVELLRSVSGETPTGWVSPGAESNDETVELLAEAGFDYHGDRQDDELPYLLHAPAKTLVEVPYRVAGNLNDIPLLTRTITSVSAAARHVTDAFDAYYEAAATRPLLFNYGTHPYISGRPDNAKVLRALLEHIHRHDDVWVTNYREVAVWWRQTQVSA